MRSRLGFAAVVSVLFALPAFAHHSHGNYVDSFTDISGTVKEVHLLLPHSWIYLEVKDPKGGEAQIWALEATGRNGLERIGDLLLSFANSAQAAGGRLDPEDTRDLTQMATILEKMLTDVGESFSGRDVGKAVDVLRADAEMDRLRNLIFLRHIENPENIHRQASLQVIFMTQSLERAGDHAKNLAEEVCHFVSGRPVRHVLIAYDKPVEQMFIDYLRRRDHKS